MTQLQILSLIAVQLVRRSMETPLCIINIYLNHGIIYSKCSSLLLIIYCEVMTKIQISFYVIAILAITILTYLYTSVAHAPELLDDTNQNMDLDQN